MVKKNPLATDLIGEKTIKTNEKINFFGNLDEASAFIMDFYHIIEDNNLKEFLVNVVENLSIAMAETAGGKIKLEEEKLIKLQKIVNEYNNKIGAFNGFILPGTTPIGAKAHIVRTVVRRAERAYAKVYENYGGSKVIFEYLNKLSTLFYLIARNYDEN